MPIKNDQYNMIYFPVPKVAYVSITKILLGEGFKGKLPFSNCTRKEVNDYPHYFWFTFVRHPLDRLISLYHYLAKYVEEPFRQIVLKTIGYDTLPDLYEFLWSVDNTPDKEINGHAKSQHLLFPFHRMNFIGRFENIQEDWSRLNLPELPHLNKTEHGPWRDYYYDQGKLRPIAMRLQERYKRDMELFRYPTLEETEK